MDFSFGLSWGLSSGGISPAPIISVYYVSQSSKLGIGISLCFDLREVHLPLHFFTSVTFEAGPFEEWSNIFFEFYLCVSIDGIRRGAGTGQGRALEVESFSLCSGRHLNSSDFNSL